MTGLAFVVVFGGGFCLGFVAMALLVAAHGSDR